MCLARTARRDLGKPQAVKSERRFQGVSLRGFAEGEFLDTVCGIPGSRTEIVMLVTRGHTSPMDVHGDGKRAGDSAARDIQIQTLRIAVRQVPVGSAKRKRHIRRCRAAPSHQPCHQQPSGKKPPPDHIYMSRPPGAARVLGPWQRLSGRSPVRPARGPVGRGGDAFCWQRRIEPADLLGDGLRLQDPQAHLQPSVAPARLARHRHTHQRQ
jgi:hypothetical protein